MLTIITIIKISPNIHDNNPSSQRGCGFETGLRRDEVASTFTVIIVIKIIIIVVTITSIIIISMIIIVTIKI